MVKTHSGFEQRACLDAIAAAECDVKQLALSLTADQFHAPAPSGGWSIGYCLEHLILSGRAFLPKWDRALEAGSATGRTKSVSFPYHWWYRQVLHMAEPPYRMKTRAKQEFVPFTRCGMEETVRRFLLLQKEIGRRVEGSEGLDMLRIKVQSPFAAWVSYPLGFSFDLALAHQRRHLWQAWRVRQQLLSDD